jgi:hypothetical protein
MPVNRRARSAILAFALACGLTQTAQAGDWLFHKCQQSDCCDTTVKLPAQKVVVETAAPRVTVQETTRSVRGVTPVIGTVYMPMAMPMMGLGTGQKDADVQPDDNPLRGVHAAELAQLRHARALAIAKADLEAAQRVLDRMNTSDCPKPPPEPIKPPTDMSQRIKAVGDKIDKIADRLNAIEKLSLIHDNYLRDEIQNANPPMKPLVP